jgi:hypothetical protein
MVIYFLGYETCVSKTGMGAGQAAIWQSGANLPEAEPSGLYSLTAETVERNFSPDRMLTGHCNTALQTQQQRRDVK